MTFNYTATVKRVTDIAVKTVRGEADYAALVAHFSLTAASESAVLTDAARMVVVDGAHAAGTQIGESITTDMLKGQDPGADAAHRTYWKAARAVRAGLVKAIDKGEPEAKDATLRVSLSGEGGLSDVIDMESDLGKAILAHLAAKQG